MKKKVIFMVINMNIGGTEKALLNMIAEMPQEKYDITILMLEEYGDFLPYIPDEVHLEYVTGYEDIKHILNEPPLFTIGHLFKTGKWLKAGKLFFIHLATKALKERSLFFHYLLKDYKMNHNEFDAAVAYAGPMDFISFFVLKKINAKRKIQWIHFDVTKIGFNEQFAKKTYKKFDKICVVSTEAKQKLLSFVPFIVNRTEEFPNMISQKTILNQAKQGQGFNGDFDGFRILTIGRLTSEKGQDLAIQACARLIKDGYNVRWYCVGEGNSRKELEKAITHYNLEDRFILLGADTNPYQYLQQCDIYVQPSRYEGYCITIMEAKLFNKPILTTNVNGVNEQLRNGETGLIVNIDQNEIYYGVKRLMDNENLRENLSESLSNEKYDSSQEKDKIMELLEV